jgi:hypothetical protein
MHNNAVLQGTACASRPVNRALGSMTKEMEKRKAKPEYTAEISRLSDAVQKRRAENHPDVFKYPMDSSEVDGFFREQIEAQGSSIFITTDLDRTVGYVWCTIQKR